MPWLMGSSAQDGVDVLDAARKQRNVDLYDGAGTVGDSDVDDLMTSVVRFEEAVRSWLASKHPELIES